jgi:hypothetical protein
VADFSKRCDKYDAMLAGRFPVSASPDRAPLFPSDRRSVLQGLTLRARGLGIIQGQRILDFVAGGLWGLGCYTPEELEIEL